MGRWNTQRIMLEQYLSETMTLAKDRLPGQLDDLGEAFKDSSHSGAQNLVNRLLDKLQEGILSTAAESSIIGLKSELRRYFEEQASLMIQQECEEFTKSHLILFCKQVASLVYDPLPVNVRLATGDEHRDQMEVFASFDEGAGQEIAVAGGVMISAVGFGVGAFALGIGTVFFGLITVINPLILFPLAALALITGTGGGYLLAKAKAKAVGRILAKIEPQLRVAIVENGFESNGQHHNSLLTQVQVKMDEITDKTKATIRPVYEQFRDQARAGFEEAILKAEKGDGQIKAELEGAESPVEVVELAYKHATVPLGLRMSAE